MTTTFSICNINGRDVLRTEQNMKVNFGRIESLCGFIIEVEELKGLIYVTHSVYNDSHFMGGLNRVNGLLYNAPELINYLGNELVKYKL